MDFGIKLQHNILLFFFAFDLENLRQGVCHPYRVPLESEVEFLKKYVAIEKMRFKNQLTVDIRNNVKDNSVMIPPMLIQPVIENSIKHGIRNRKGAGRIDVELNKNRDVITVTVEDNGVGREFTKTLPKIGPNGLGVKILNQRLNLLNDKFSTKVNNITYIDLDDNDIPRGTKVVINVLFRQKE